MARNMVKVGRNTYVSQEQLDTTERRARAGNSQAIGQLKGWGKPLPLGDRLPQVPSITETPTGITGPGGEQTEAELAQGLVGAVEEQSQAELESAQGLQEEAVGVQEGVEGQVADTGERIEGLQGDLTTAQDDLDTQIDTALEDVSNLATEATSEFDRLRERFGTVSSAALADIDAKSSEALSQVMDGRSQAMQAAVQGIQGNISSAVAKIQADPNLSNAQKQSMIAQTRLSGASSMAGAIGQSILGFNQLAADVATKFGSFTAQIQAQIVGEEGAFGRAEGDTFARATVASKEITNQLLGIQATSDAAYAGSQTALEGIRSQAEMSGNQLLLNNLPNLGEPVLNITDAASTAMLLGTDLLVREFERDSTSFQQEVTMMLFRSQIGTPLARLAEAGLSGLATGGPAGAAIGVGAEVLQGFLNPSPTI